MLRRLGLAIGALAIGAMLFGHAQAANVTTVAATLREFKVDVAPTAIEVGKPVQFVVTNTGKIQHEFVIEKAGADDQHLTTEVEGKEVDAEIEAFNPGETKTLTWTFTEPGAYQAACHLPGHYEAGMVMQFNVGPATASALPEAGGGPVVIGLAVVTLAGVLVIGGVSVWRTRASR